MHDENAFALRLRAQYVFDVRPVDPDSNVVANCTGIERGQCCVRLRSSS